MQQLVRYYSQSFYYSAAIAWVFMSLLLWRLLSIASLLILEE